MATQASQREQEGFTGRKFDRVHYENFFTHLTGKKPYLYQIELAEKLVHGQSFILRAPTGAGKTWATVAPFIYSCLTHCRIADRLIYSLPLRALASDLYDSTSRKLEELSEMRGHISRSSKNRRYHADDPFYIGLQMGGQQDDPFFEGDITFTTIDQLLSAYLFAPVSLPNRVGNIGAGALIGSLLVFDEIHLLDPERSLATTIEMLFRLKGLAQFVLMTATMPDSVMQWLADKLDATAMSLSADEVRQLPSHATKQREFEWRPSPLNSDDIVSEHKNRTIVIVNTVGRAQELYYEVCKRVESQPNPPLIFLLHSRFFQEDRKNWESKLADYYGPDATSNDAILISTQVVEAGMDISADVLLTELAPLNSLLQRAGRVARYQDRDTGKLLVFDLQKDSQDRIKLGPYRDSDTAEIIIATRELLASENKLPLLSYADELEWLKCIHEAPDLKALQHLNSLHTHAQQVLRAMDGLDEAACSRLIRETGSVNVVLTDKPEELRFTSNEWPELLGVPRTSLFRLRDACAQAGPSEWILKVPDEIQSESNRTLDFQWRVISNPASVAWLVAINPAHAAYSDKIGLELGKSSEPVPKVKYKVSPPVPRYSYQKESFVTHAKRVAQQGARILEKSIHCIGRLEVRHGELSLHDTLMLACTLHDTGKLQLAWQKEAEQRQEHIDAKMGRPHKSELLAHTDFDLERDRGDKWRQFPPHAASGGFALLPYFIEHFPAEIVLVLCTAVTRHHGTHTKELGKFELIPDAATILEDCLPASVPRPIKVKFKPEAADLESFSEEYLLHMRDNENAWPLYASMIRVLRLADQGSFQG